MPRRVSHEWRIRAAPTLYRKIAAKLRFSNGFTCFSCRLFCCLCRFFIIIVTFALQKQQNLAFHVLCLCLTQMA